MASGSRCGICEKTTNNRKQKLHLVTIDGEDKLQFGYYSYYKKDLNKSLLNTKVHEKCYKRCYSKWHSAFVENVMASSDIENEIISINDANDVSKKCCSSNVCNIGINDDDRVDDVEADITEVVNNVEIDDDDGVEMKENIDETNNRFCSNTNLSNRSIILENKSPLGDISNIDCSSYGTSCNRLEKPSSTIDLLIDDINDENNGTHCNSLSENNINPQYHDVFYEKEKIDYDVYPLEEHHINCDTNAVSDSGEHQKTVTNDCIEEESLFLSGSQDCMNIEQQATYSPRQSPLRSMYPTSTPTVPCNKIQIKRRRRRRSEEGIPQTSGTNDRKLIYDSPLNELQAWLTSILRDGHLIPLINVQERYKQIIESYDQHESHFDSDIRCDSLRKQLESRFPDQFHFETVSKRDGTYIALNNISHYSRTAINLSKSSTFESSDHQRSTTVFSNPSNEDQLEKCEVIFNAVRLLRNHMKDTLHVLETLYTEPEKMTEINNDIFADSVPLIIRNFIGLLTSSNRQFKKLEIDYDYYDLFTTDLFKNSCKSLKNTVISHDILNARHDHIVSPKHILLANEICKHGRSNELLSIFNRFGHVASYKTISRIHRKIAYNQMANCSLASGVLPDCYLVQVADNFDLNRETLHGERSYHFLNRILVQTPENNHASRSNDNVNDDDTSNDNSPNIEVFKLPNNTNELSSTTIPSFDDTDASPYEFEEASSCSPDQRRDELRTPLNQVHTSMGSLRAVDQALRDHSLSYYHDYEPFVDHSLDIHLLAYGLIQSYYNRIGNSDLPLYSGFMAIHLPHKNRPRHKVTFMPPINQDPNKLETAEECMRDMKKMLIDSKLQNDAVLVIDERIYRQCIQIKDDKWSDFEGVFLYPGDFHLMKCSMVVIWDILTESGIDTLIGYLYKGATHRAVLSVTHFNKTLRAIKLLYTALLILLHNEYIRVLSVTMINEIDQLMNLKPTDFTNVEENRKWYTSVLEYLLKSKWQEGFDTWIKNNVENHLKFRFWTFVLFDLISPLIKLYTALRTSNFDARNAAVSELAELFFATNHRQYARLTARHLSDLRVSPQHLIDHLSKSFSVCRSNRNFSSIALDQTIEVTINKMGKGHGGITGRCSNDLIDIWTNSYTFRSLLSTITCELAGVESNYNSIESHIECSPTRMQADHVDLQIILDKLSDEKLFSLDTNNVTQLFTGKIIHQDIIESNCQCRTIGANALKTYVHERLVNCSKSLDTPLHKSPLLRIYDNDTYGSTRSGVRKSAKKKSSLDLRDIDREIRRILHLSEYRPIDLVSAFGHELASAPVSLCSLEDMNILNQQSKSKDTYDFLKEKFPSAIYSKGLPASNQQQALVIDGSSLLHINPRAGNNVFDYSLYLLVQHIVPLFVNYSRVDIIFDSSKSRDLKSFINRHGGTKTTQPMYDNIPRNSLLQTGKAYQNFVTSNRARFAAAVVECWKETQCTQSIPIGVVFVVAGPGETATKLEKDKQPMNVIELESNQIEADTRIILHINQLTQNSFATIVVKSIDTDVMILCIYHASLYGLKKLFVDATLPKKPLKIIDCTHIHNELVNKYDVDPLSLLVVYALSGCDTCSFIRNVGKRTFMQILFDTPNDFTDLEKLSALPINEEDIVAAENMLVRCFRRLNRRCQQPSASTSITRTIPPENDENLSINQLRVSMAVEAFKKNKDSIAASLPPTHDSLFHHCLRVARQVQIWLQAPDSRIYYPDFEDSGFQMIDGRLQVKWMDKLPCSKDPHLLTCKKHKGQCIQCVCIRNKLPCTIFCACPKNCPNRSLSQITTGTSQKIMKITKKRSELLLHNPLTSLLSDEEVSNEGDTSDKSSITDNLLADELNEIHDLISSSSDTEAEEYDSF